MPSPRGLSTNASSRRWLQVWTVAATLWALGTQVAILLRGAPVHERLLHSVTVCAIALVIYSWVVFSSAVGAALGAIALATTVWSWAATHSLPLAGDVPALVILAAVTWAHQRDRMLRLHRLEQTLDDLSEESYLKAQSLRLVTQTSEGLQHKLARYQQLQTIAEQLSRTVDLQAIAQLAVSQAFGLIGKSDACLLFLVDPEQQELALVASEKAADVPVIRGKQGDQLDRYVLRTQRPLLVNDVLRDFRFSHAGGTDRPIRSVMSCPVRGGQGAEGALRLDSRQASIYTQDDLRFMDILLDLVNAAVANARLFAKTQQLALTDGLTGLYRRQPFLDQLTRELARSNRTREPLAVLMVDVDDFKRYNDEYGHTAGDLILKTVAGMIAAEVPPDGMAARYGGEEFAILLSKTSKPVAVEVAERIRDAVQRGARPAGQGAAPVTLSIGVAEFPGDGHAALELIRRADERLYQAKRAGKNRVWSS